MIVININPIGQLYFQITGSISSDRLDSNYLSDLLTDASGGNVHQKITFFGQDCQNGYFWTLYWNLSHSFWPAWYDGICWLVVLRPVDCTVNISGFNGGRIPPHGFDPLLTQRVPFCTILRYPFLKAPEKFVELRKRFSWMSLFRYLTGIFDTFFK